MGLRLNSYGRTGYKSSGQQLLRPPRSSGRTAAVAVGRCRQPVREGT